PLKGLEKQVVHGLAKKKLVNIRATLSKPKVGPRMERSVELLVSPDEFDDVLALLGRPSKQAAVLRYLVELDDPFPTVKAVKEAVGCTDSPVKALAEKGWLEILPAQTFVAAKPGDLSSSNQDAAALLAYLQQSGPTLLDALSEKADALQALLEKDLIVKFDEPPRLTLRLSREDAPEALIQLRRTQRHAAVLNLLAAEDGPVWIGWIYAQTKATLKTLQDLARVEAIAFDEARRWRDPLANRVFTLDTPPILTPEQRDLMDIILPALDRYGAPFLIHGVTGSGKTEIYLQAIDKTLEQGKEVIFLAPEVMLATQIVQRVQARFPGKTALWHSALSPGERFDTWERARQGELPIVVGPRSALFAPLKNLGLIIVDEEHEPAYKQDRVPTFHARDLAIQYARLLNIPLIMGSATPDVVSYRKAERGEYHLLHLPNRILAHKKHLAVQERLLSRGVGEWGSGGVEGRGARAAKDKGQVTNDLVALPLPSVEIVDLREELKAGNRTIFSRALQKGIEETLKAGEQVILFLNRRGTATFVNCRDCGYVMVCPQCDTTLTYHAPTRQMVCHYCGYRSGVPQTCPECHSKRIKYFGLGTERVEAHLRRMFPYARPIRLDQDTTRRRGSHYTFLQHFVEGRANVMIGTQMVAKGLDLPLVTLVGVISADTALYLPEFRAAERTFQILTQVAGRAGRSPLGGRVIVQTYTPEQPALLAAAEHDYLGFYGDELRFRYEQGYPPFKRLARLTYSGYGQEKSQAAAQEMADRLRLWAAQQGFPAVQIIGPAPTYVQRIRSKYRWQILLRAPNPPEVLGPVPLPLGWKVDIDPVSLL
ncbi:MAG TPA: primosomal protein N', partial [Anaerolineae bacterium]|nr:primosomal protein N' [Anaerolineae bacterium]